MLERLVIAAIVAPLIIQPAHGQSAEDVIVESQGGSEVRGDWVLGARVTTPEGVLIGSIEDLILDEEDGSVNAAIVSVGGFLGFGGKEIAVDWSELQMDYDANEVTLGITREEAEAAPEYTFRDRVYPPPPPPEPATGTGATGQGTGTTGMGGATGTTGGAPLEGQ
jgi:sporulation protein YlmC with PRC-barrel domain